MYKVFPYWDITFYLKKNNGGIILLKNKSQGFLKDITSIIFKFGENIGFLSDLITIDSLYL